MSRGAAARACVVGVATLAVLALTGAARADDASEPLAIAYDAPADCPTSTAFFREISMRTPRARAALPNERARVMHVVVTKSGDENAGRLWIEDAGTSSTARAVSGKTCSEVVGALALIGALAVDPRASTAPMAAPAEPSRDAEPPPDAGAPPPAASSAPVTTATPDRPAPVPGGPSTEPEARARFEAGLQIEAAFVAGAVPSGRLFADFTIGPRDAIFAPALRVSVARSLEVDRAAAIGGATLRWTTAGLDVCPVRFVLVRSLAVRPCAGGSGGVLDASGTGIASTSSRSRPWATLSALGRLVWEPLAWLDVDVELGGIAPLYRESFVFVPGVSVYEAPAVAFLSRAGVGLRFP
ncbi:MAG: Type secretion system hydrolase TadA/VirB11/CpaF, TadA subfamily [Labilithrix sp.]|nr:Type secretion system hydrolase TadA/VirB11/CpaF, TadA subfamily [Labilithrix sp.]